MPPRAYQLIKTTVDLAALPPTGGKVQLIGPGQPVTGIFLNTQLPAGLNFRLLYGNNTFGLIFGPGYRLDHTSICPPIQEGIFATWDVAAPGTIAEVELEIAGSGGTTA